MKKQGIYVVPHGARWAVKRGGEARASSLHNTQASAISARKQMAKAGNTELSIHGRNGQIREKNSYGHDAHPPKG